jgi:hypothetical protein
LIIDYEQKRGDLFPFLLYFIIFMPSLVLLDIHAPQKAQYAPRVIGISRNGEKIYIRSSTLLLTVDKLGRDERF